MDTNPIKCPKCGEFIQITEAITHQIEETVLASVQNQHKKELQKARETAEKEVEALQKDLEAKLAKRFEDKLSQEIKLAKEEAIENKAKNKELLEQLTEMTRSLRQLKQEKDEVKLEMEKTLAQEEEKIRADAIKKANDEQHLKILEKDKQLQDAIKANEELRRKLQQGSQQTQGEVLELELEENLHKEFPNDKITPVSKGVRGGDIIQEVWDKNGNYCGKILWELKNAKWSALWYEKLRADQRTIHAESAVLVSEHLPDDVRISGFRNGIWLTERTYAVCLGSALRAGVIQLYYAKQSVKGKNEKMEVLYSYLSGTEFTHRIEAIVEAFSGMQEEIEKEKRYFMNKWARDEKHLRAVIDSTYGMHGDLRAIVGGTLPQIKGLSDEPDQLIIDGSS